MGRQIHYNTVIAAMAWCLAACGGGEHAASAPPTAKADSSAKITEQSATIKQHPGHYIIVNPTDSYPQLIAAAERSGVTGIYKRYTWRDIEISLGNYNFSQIRADLAVAASLKKYLLVFVDIEPSAHESILPDYIQQSETVVNQAGTTVLKIWSGYTIDRLLTLYAELAAHFDQEPYFEGVQIRMPPVWLGEQGKAKFAYSTDSHREAMLRLAVQSKNLFRQSQLFWSFAAVSAQSKPYSDIIEGLTGFGLVIGGAAMLPDDTEWRDEHLPIYRALQGRAGLFAVVPLAGYAHTRSSSVDSAAKYWSPPELLDYMTQHHINYLFWYRQETKETPDTYHWNDVSAALEAAASKSTR